MDKYKHGLLSYTEDINESGKLDHAASQDTVPVMLNPSELQMLEATLGRKGKPHPVTGVLSFFDVGDVGEPDSDTGQAAGANAGGYGGGVGDSAGPGNQGSAANQSAGMGSTAATSAADMGQGFAESISNSLESFFSKENVVDNMMAMSPTMSAMFGAAKGIGGFLGDTFGGDAAAEASPSTSDSSSGGVDYFPVLPSTSEQPTPSVNTPDVDVEQEAINPWDFQLQRWRGNEFRPQPLRRL